MIDASSNEPAFYSFNIKVNKCSGSCSSINHPYAKLCVPDVTKNTNVKIFNSLSRMTETRYVI